jgi:hypothetical protein
VSTTTIVIIVVVVIIVLGASSGTPAKNYIINRLPGGRIEVKEKRFSLLGLLVVIGIAIYLIHLFNSGAK